MSTTVERICRYPVKGLSPQDLEQTDVVPGEGLPGDRQFAIALSTTRFDPSAPQPLPKTSFLMLMRNERLAALETLFDTEQSILTIRRDGKQVARGNLNVSVGRAMIGDFFAAYLKDEVAGKPKVLVAPVEHMFSDNGERGLSIINLATVRDLERVVGEEVDPVRFRANIYIDGTEPWAEFGWIDRELVVGGARLRVTARIDRCAATTVRPGVGVRDINIPQALKRGFGHIDCGVYAQITTAGAFAVGDTVTVAD